jgi:dCTP deaminase
MVQGNDQSTELLAVPRGLLPDWAIAKLAREQGMIAPFHPEKISQGKISYGLSSYGYDMTLAPEFKLLRPDLEPGTVLDPKRMPPEYWLDIEADELLLPAGGCALGRSVEYWRMPTDVEAIVLGKSTWARTFLLPLMTPMEAGWHCTLTLELHNLTPYPLKLYAHEGIAQALFFRGGAAPFADYGARGGKYDGQLAVTLGFVRGG